MRFRFSENNTAIKLLEQSQPQVLTLFSSTFDTTEIAKDIADNRTKFLSNIDVIEPTFYEAFRSTVETLNKGIPDSTFQDVCGTFIIQDTPEAVVNTYFYNFTGKIKDDVFYLQASVYWFVERPGLPKSYLRAAYCNKGEKKQLFFEDRGEKQAPGFYQHAPLHTMLLVFMMHLFKVHCHVERKELEPVSRITEGKNEYANISKYKMNYLNAAWFTEAVASGPFWVGLTTGGFWKNVATGPGKSERVQKFILPFMKSGYHRKAGVAKLREGQNNESE